MRSLYLFGLWFTVFSVLYIIMPMSFFRKLRWNLIGILGKLALWIWAKSTRMKIIGQERYKELRDKGKAVIFLVWHGRIFIVPYFFRKRGIMPLISPSKDGEFPAQIMSRWGYRNLRGSSSHAVIRVWNRMKNELKKGGEVIIVPDGPRGPDREMKLGGIKLAQETGAVLVPFTFSTSRKKFLKSWDKFLIFYPFTKVVAVYGPPMNVDPALKDDALEKERQKIERVLIELDEKVDRFYG
jgi:lysophospholipid acyltransferase (LPLAT)-like uncharacterized protein